MNPRLRELHKKLQAAKAQQRAIVDAAESEDRDLTEDENAAFIAAEEEVRSIEKRIERLNATLQAEAEQPRRVLESREDYPAGGQASIKVQPPNFIKDPKKGFSSPREFLTGVITSTRAGKIEDDRLRFLVTDSNGKAVHQIGKDGQVVDVYGQAVNMAAGSDEQSTFSDPYGGFFIPEAFTPGPLQVTPEPDPMAGRVRTIPMSAPVVKLNARVDKNHSSSVSGGFQVYRRAEGDSASSSRVTYEQIRLEASTLYGLAYATEELLNDSPVSFAAIIEAGFRDEIPNKLIDERLNGTGVGEYEGIVNAGCKISVAKETGQSADTIVTENLIKMRARCWNYSNAVWLYNHDCLPQLMTLVLEIGTGGVPMWNMNVREGEPDTLLGRPAYATEYCETLGDAGDIVLAVWSEYLEGTYQPFQSAESMHVRFLENERTFRVTVRNAGAHWWRSALTPKNSTNTLSPVVYLAARA